MALDAGIRVPSTSRPARLSSTLRRAIKTVASQKDQLEQGFGVSWTPGRGWQPTSDDVDDFRWAWAGSGRRGQPGQGTG